MSATADADCDRLLSPCHARHIRERGPHLITAAGHQVVHIADRRFIAGSILLHAYLTAYYALSPGALRGADFPDKGFYEGIIYSAGVGGDVFSSAQHLGSLGPAGLKAKRVALSDRKRLLDVGGGSGAYTLAFCAANAQLETTILDFPQTVETERDMRARPD